MNFLIFLPLLKLIFKNSTTSTLQIIKIFKISATKCYKKKKKKIVTQYDSICCNFFVVNIKTLAFKYFACEKQKISVMFEIKLGAVHFLSFLCYVLEWVEQWSRKFRTCPCICKFNLIVVVSIEFGGKFV